MKKNKDTNHERFMREALKLAAKLGNITLPNPRVGAVLVRNNKIISKGFHRAYGAPHAEIDCIKNVDSCKDTVLYVNLEPCNHQGKTPPCTDAIISSGIKHVVIATKDTNTNVKGGGLDKLKEAGIEITCGICETEARELNKDYFFAHKNRIPYIILKYAMTLDGKIADNYGSARWISGKKSRELTHIIRSRVSGILIGKNTAIRDNPKLDIRGIDQSEMFFRPPVRIVLDTLLRIPTNLNLTNPGQDSSRTIIATTVEGGKKIEEFRKRGVEIITVPDKAARQIIIKPLLEELYKKGIYSVLVEGGSQINASFFNERIGEELHIFVAPILLGGENIFPPFGGVPSRSISSALKLQIINQDFLDNDYYIHAKPLW